ncbi:hypothetical protein BU23DRAFT_574572 [Bimuria novae-zelandiae CBS 107.79]|uniref:Uncharacterized protein n=1 Tax=Bimuria novae-zelandiae CBS 107.79 TaxID=1447943 RepID=A0A6A5UM74_9PLEO|nr:hypothetical protein BU23DRAFT_574572 [Bimuria novae-zelandiae CBS 107.79]
MKRHCFFLAIILPLSWISNPQARKYYHTSNSSKSSHYYTNPVDLIIIICIDRSFHENEVPRYTPQRTSQPLRKPFYKGTLSLTAPSATISSITFTSIIRDTATSATINRPPAATTTIVEKLPPNVGPIPLAAFIPLVFFAPFFIGFTIWVLHTCTIKRCKDKQRARREATSKDPAASVSRDVEMQIASFVNAPPLARSRIRKEKGKSGLGAV